MVKHGLRPSALQGRRVQTEQMELLGQQALPVQTGTNGTNGAAGATGPTGPAGTNGTNGTNGSNGAAGATGPTGPTGTAGTNGTNGTNGAAGATGPTGPTGSLSAGSSAGNTPYWNGSAWVVNSSNIYNNGGSVGIGNPSPNSSAILDIASTAQGMLPPRMTTTQRNAINVSSFRLSRALPFSILLPTVSNHL